MAKRKYKVRSVDVWNEELQPVLTGVVTAIEPMQVDDEERVTMLIDDGISKIRVWHSKALEEAFEQAEVGDGIRLHHQGKVPLKGGKTFNRISVQVWEGGNLDDIISEREQAHEPTSSLKDS